MGVVILTRATSNVRDQATTRSAFAVASPARISSTIMTIRRRSVGSTRTCRAVGASQGRDDVVAHLAVDPQRAQGILLVCKM
jgi:hypothetical protein